MKKTSCFLLVLFVLSGFTTLHGGDPEECVQHCEEEAAAFLRQCIKENGEDCEGRAAEILDNCIRELCEDPDPTCEDLCEMHANEVYEMCREEGMGEEHCWQIRKEALQECIENECNGGGEPTCEEMCEMHADEIYNMCREEGMGEEHCWQIRKEALQECIANECDDGGEPTCEDICEEHADAVFHACLEQGLGEEACWEERQRVLEECLANECKPVEPTCEERCEIHADKVFHACLEEGLSEEACWQKRQEILQNCIEDECNGGEPTCEEICMRHADAIFAQCRKEGGSEGHCAELRELALQDCLEKECGDPEEDDFSLSVVTPERFSGCGPVNVFVELTNTQDIQGYSFGIAHDSDVVALTGIDFVDCPPVQALNDGAGPDFFRVDLDAGTGQCNDEVNAGGTVYMIASTEAPSVETLAAGIHQPIARFTYEAVEGVEPETSSALNIVGCLGDELPWNIVLTVDFVSINPDIQPAEFSVGECRNKFKRGDANLDDRHDLSDAVSVLSYLFEDGAGPLPCEDVGDANDDGRLDLADPITLLDHLFGSNKGGLPMPAEVCGADPTEDDFPICDTYFLCD